MANTNKRLDDLERATGGGGETIVFVTWGDGLITHPGEQMTQAEYQRRNPGQEIINLTWGDWGEDETIETA